MPTRPSPPASPVSSQAAGLIGTVRNVHDRLRRIVDDRGFHDHQRELLKATVEQALARSTGGVAGDPLGTMLLLARAHGPLEPEATQRVGAFCMLYVMALDLFDDVQDEDLAGKPHEDAGPAIAINSAIALSFLANRELHGALEHLPTEARRRSLLDIADRTGVAAVTGQHRDLIGTRGASTPEEVLAMQQAKTSSVVMLAELGGLLGAVDEGTRARYHRVGEELAKLVQVRDDLRDVYGKSLSPDLMTGKVTYPLACFLQDADDDDRAQLAELVDSLPESMGQVRRRLYDSGAVRRTAATLESCRRAIHEELAAVSAVAPGYLRVVLDVVDQLASGVYVVPDLAPTAALRRPGNGPFASATVRELERLRARLTPLGLPRDLPALQPWHQPHWMYLPSRHTIFFPDLDDLGDEILPFQAALLDSPDLDEPRRLLTAQIPLVLAHELFHFWRDASGRMTEDHWHEEWAANRLGVGYALAHEPAALTEALALADRVVARFPNALGPEVDRLLEDCRRERTEARGYGMGATAVAVVGLEMVRRLATERPSLGEDVAALLGPRSIAATA